MPSRAVTILATASMFALACAPGRLARADNPMGYRLLSAEQARTLPHNHGALGMNIESAQEITDSGMTFDLLRIRQVRPGSAAAQVGLKGGDEIIAADGQVFATMAAFAAYVGSKPPGSRITIDYIPAGGAPSQAQRVSIVVGQAGSSAPLSPSASTATPESTGMSTRSKIGVAAAALLGCYVLGCFSSKAGSSAQNRQMQPGVPPQ